MASSYRSMGVSFSVLNFPSLKHIFYFFSYFFRGVSVLILCMRSVLYGEGSSSAWAFAKPQAVCFWTGWSSWPSPTRELSPPIPEESFPIPMRPLRIFSLRCRCSHKTPIFLVCPAFRREGSAWYGIMHIENPKHFDSSILSFRLSDVWRGCIL